MAEEGGLLEEAGALVEGAGAEVVAGGLVVGAAEVGGADVGAGVVLELPVPWAWRLTPWLRYSSMPSRLRSPMLRADEKAKRAKMANSSHDDRIVLSMFALERETTKVESWCRRAEGGRR